MATKQLRYLYQIKITLADSKPPIWRRLQVHSNIKLNVFHEVVQDSMGWLNYHLHGFEKNGVRYGIKDDDFDLDIKEEQKFKLSDLLTKEKDSMNYEYDFGDGWEHKIILEKILPFDISAPLVRCIKGKRACPPEDCGGIWGYENLIEIIKDPTHEEHKAMLEWLGGELDPEYFSLVETNSMLLGYAT